MGIRNKQIVSEQSIGSSVFGRIETNLVRSTTGRFDGEIDN